MVICERNLHRKKYTSILDSGQKYLTDGWTDISTSLLTRILCLLLNHTIQTYGRTISSYRAASLIKNIYLLPLGVGTGVVTLFWLGEGVTIEMHKTQQQPPEYQQCLSSHSSKKTREKNKLQPPILFLIAAVLINAFFLGIENLKIFFLTMTLHWPIYLLYLGTGTYSTKINCLSQTHIYH